MVPLPIRLLLSRAVWGKVALNRWKGLSSARLSQNLLYRRHTFRNRGSDGLKLISLMSHCIALRHLQLWFHSNSFPRCWTR